MNQSRLIAIGGVFLAAALSVPVWGADQAHPESSKVAAARTGSLNYVEGQVSISGKSLGPEAIGKTELSPGQSLQTQVGKAELLLTPGVFLRVGDNSSVTMISPGSTDTEIRLDKGEATLEAAELRPQTYIVVAVGDARVRLAETGLYEIDADQNMVRVYQGQVFVDANNREIAVKNQQQLAFDPGASIQPEKFAQQPAQAGPLDQDQTQAPAPDQDDLYQWSSLRSSYLAEANVDEAQDEADNGSGDDWVWDPYYGAYTFIPADGTAFYSPFGWGFYSPYEVGYAPFGFYGHYDHHFDHDYHHWDNGEHHEAHYYDHFDHGAYRGPGSGGFVGRYPGGAVAGGYRMQPGEGFHPGRGGEGFHGGQGYGGRGGEVYGGRGAEGYHGGSSGEGYHGGMQGGEGFHGAGSSGGSHVMGGGGFHGGAAHGGGGGGHR
jgi:hypothetical protein